MRSNEWRSGYSLKQIIESPDTIDSRTLDVLVYSVIRVVKDNPWIINKCTHLVNFDIHPVDCAFYINAPIFLNCSLIANFFGPFTVEEISYMTGESKDHIYKIQKSALKKLKEKFKVLLEQGEF